MGRMRSRMRVTAEERIAYEIRRRIALGVYRVHEVLPSERTLAEEFKYSRSTVSAALALLAREGLVIQERGRGTRVLPPPLPSSERPIAIVYPRGLSMLAAIAPDVILVLDGIRDVFMRSGWKAELVALGRADDFATPETMCRGVEDLVEKYCGFVFAECTATIREVKELCERGLPVTVANLEVPLDVTATWVDHAEPTRQAVTHLAALGHERIALITRRPELYWYGDVLRAYREAMERVGLKPEDELIFEAERPDPESAYEAGRRMVECGQDITAIVAARDVLAWGACRAFAEAGRTLGRDLSVIGFDDFSWPAGRRFLTTFREPCYAMGAAAAEMLMERIISGRREIEKRELKAPFVLRRSAGPVLTPEQTSLHMTPLHYGSVRI